MRRQNSLHHFLDPLMGIDENAEMEDDDNDATRPSFGKANFNTTAAFYRDASQNDESAFVQILDCCVRIENLCFI